MSGCPSFTTSLGSSQVTSSATGKLVHLPRGRPLRRFRPRSRPPVADAPSISRSAAPSRRSTGGQRTPASSRFTYYLNKTDIDKLYGSNQGQQFVPLCAGAAWVDGNGDVQRCDADGVPDPWVGKGLSSDGRFDGSLKRAVCDAGRRDRSLLGILGSLSRTTTTLPTASVIDPAMSPTVTGWDLTGNFSLFDVCSARTDWDWKMG